MAPSPGLAGTTRTCPRRGSTPGSAGELPTLCQDYALVCTRIEGKKGRLGPHPVSSVELVMQTESNRSSWSVANLNSPWHTLILVSFVAILILRRGRTRPDADHRCAGGVAALAR